MATATMAEGPSRPFPYARIYAKRLRWTRPGDVITDRDGRDYDRAGHDTGSHVEASQQEPPKVEEAPSKAVSPFVSTMEWGRGRSAFDALSFIPAVKSRSLWLRRVVDAPRESINTLMVRSRKSSRH
jgi:hypothetical protein